MNVRGIAGRAVALPDPGSHRARDPTAGLLTPGTRLGDLSRPEYSFARDPVRSRSDRCRRVERGLLASIRHYGYGHESTVTIC